MEVMQNKGIYRKVELGLKGKKRQVNKIRRQMECIKVGMRG